MTENEESGGILKWAVLAVILGVLAVTLSEGLRDRVLDALFGAEEEFQYEPNVQVADPSTNGAGHEATEAAQSPAS
jgi:hypothetical protein